MVQKIHDPWRILKNFFDFCTNLARNYAVNPSATTSILPRNVRSFRIYRRFDRNVIVGFRLVNGFRYQAPKSGFQNRLFLTSPWNGLDSTARGGHNSYRSTDDRTRNVSRPPENDINVVALSSRAPITPCFVRSERK